MDPCPAAREAIIEAGRLGHASLPRIVTRPAGGMSTKGPRSAGGEPHRAFGETNWFVSDLSNGMEGDAQDAAPAGDMQRLAPNPRSFEQMFDNARVSRRLDLGGIPHADDPINSPR